MKSDINHVFALHEILLDCYVNDGSYAAAESFALAKGICRHFELDVSHSDILDVIYSVEQHMEEYWATEDIYIPF